MESLFKGEGDWPRRVRECLARKKAEPGVSYILTDEEGNTWRI